MIGISGVRTATSISLNFAGIFSVSIVFVISVHVSIFWLILGFATTFHIRIIVVSYRRQRAFSSLFLGLFALPVNIENDESIDQEALDNSIKILNFNKILFIFGAR